MSERSKSVQAWTHRSAAETPPHRRRRGARRVASSAKPDLLRSRTIGAPGVLALVGITLLAYQAWSIADWLLDGPAQIDTHRDDGGATLVAARIIEVAMVLGTLAVTAVVVRDCRRQRQLTVDAMLLTGLAATVFWDTSVNMFEPLWLYSSDWINLNDWWGNAPLAGTRDSGQLAIPILFLFFIYTGVTLAGVIAINKLQDTALRRRPSTRPITLTVATLALTFVACLAICTTMNALHLWSAPVGAPFLIDADDWRLGIAEPVYGAVWFTLLAALRRGMLRRATRAQRARLRPVVSTLATIGAVNLTVIVPSAFVALEWHLAADGYRPLPPALVSGACDAPGWTGTRYGPCPGAD